MKFSQYNYITELKSVNRCRPNNVHSTKFGFPESRKGTFKTLVMITCMDNRTRRLWCHSDEFGYKLFVNMGGERVLLKYGACKFECYEWLEEMIKPEELP